MALREVYARFGVQVEGQKELGELDHAAEKTAEHLEHGEEAAKHAEGTFHKLGEAIEGLVGIWAGSELVKEIGETTESLAHLKDVSEQTGLSTDDLQFYGFVVGQVGGEVGDFDTALTGLQRSLKGSAGATGAHAAALNKLGISYKDAATGAPRDLNEILPEIFENFGKLGSEQEQAAAATDLFGRSGLKMLPVLRQGKKGLEEYRKTFAEAGGPTSEESIEKAEEYEKAVKRLSNAFGGLKADLVVGVLPTMEHIVDTVTHGIVGFQDWAKHTTLAENSTLALAVALGGPLLGALGPFLKPGLKFAGVYLAVDDLLGFLEGKDSEIGHLLDAAFGEGTAYSVRAWVKDAEAAFGDFNTSTQARYDALTGLNTSFTRRAVALFVTMIDDMTKGFPALSAGWDSTLAGVEASVIEFIASVLDKWNAFSGSLKLPPALETLANIAVPGSGTAANANIDALHADTSGLHNEAVGLRQRQVNSAFKTMAALGGQENAEDPRAAYAALEAARGTGKRTEVPRTQAEEDAGRRAVQVPIAQSIRDAGVSATLNDQRKLELHFAAGTDKSVVAEIKSQVAQIMKDQNREALQILTQRAKAK
jgi:hypothetical protein